MLHRTPSRLALVLALAGAPACVEEVAVPPAETPQEAGLGQPQQVTLRFLRFDVQNYEQAVSLAQLRKIPRKILDDLWLVDYDLTQSVSVVLEELSTLPPAEAEKLSPAAQNMRRLLNMTADSFSVA